jgi:hypothetical protein
MRIIILICCLLFPTCALAQFENNPAWFGDLATRILEGRNQADAVQKGECVWLDKNPDPYSKAGLNCHTNVGGIDVYTIGTETPQETGMVHLVGERAVLKSAFRTVLVLTIGMFDFDFFKSDSFDQKLGAFLNNISRQPPKGGPPLVMQGLNARYEGQAFFHSIVKSEAVSIKILPR